MICRGDIRWIAIDAGPPLRVHTITHVGGDRWLVEGPELPRRVDGQRRLVVDAAHLAETSAVARPIGPAPRRTIPASARCRECRTKYAQDGGLCRKCGDVAKLAAGLPVGASVRAPRAQATPVHGSLNGYPLGASCRVRVVPPRPPVVYRERAAGRVTEFEVVWDGR